uniref:Uncharacterized protein n=1 Tax=Acrobeloides nanus TaxID=290746 RepID=A0A914DB60_9BILA
MEVFLMSSANRLHNPEAENEENSSIPQNLSYCSTKKVIRTRSMSKAQEKANHIASSKFEPLRVIESEEIINGLYGSKSKKKFLETSEFSNEDQIDEKISGVNTTQIVSITSENNFANSSSSQINDSIENHQNSSMNASDSAQNSTMDTSSFVQNFSLEASSLLQDSSIDTSNNLTPNISLATSRSQYEKWYNLPSHKVNFTTINNFIVEGFSYNWKVTFKGPKEFRGMCRNCFNIQQTQRRFGKSSGSLGSLVYIVENELVYGDPACPRGLKHICEDPQFKDLLATYTPKDYKPKILHDQLTNIQSLIDEVSNETVQNLTSNTSVHENTIPNNAQDPKPFKRRRSSANGENASQKVPRMDEDDWDLKEWTPEFSADNAFKISGYDYVFKLNRRVDPELEFYTCSCCIRIREQARRKNRIYPGSVCSLRYNPKINKAYGNPSAPRGYPHICNIANKEQEQYSKTSPAPILHDDDDNKKKSLLNLNIEVMEPESNQRVLNIQNLTSSSDKQNQSNERVRPPKDKIYMDIKSKVFKGHVYEYRFESVARNKSGPYFYYLCTACRKIKLATKNFNYIPYLRVSIETLEPLSEMEGWGSADHPHNGSHYCTQKYAQSSTQIQPQQEQNISLDIPASSSSGSTVEQLSLSNLTINSFAAMPKTSASSQVETRSNRVAGISNKENHAPQSDSKNKHQNLTNKPNWYVVAARSPITRSVVVKNSAYKFHYPHADTTAPIITSNDPETLENDQIYANKQKFEIQFNEVCEYFGANMNDEQKLLLITDTLLVGLDDMVFENCKVLRAEYPFMPSWLIKSIFKKKKNLDILTSNVKTIFYTLGYDLIRCYKNFKTSQVANLIEREFDDFIDAFLDSAQESHKKMLKTFVFITIPAMGILRDSISVFNSDMKMAVARLQTRYDQKARIRLLDWACLLEDAETEGLSSEAHSFDERLRFLLGEMKQKYGLKLNYPFA